MEPIESLATVYDGAWPEQVESVLFGPPGRSGSIEAQHGFDALRSGVDRPPGDLIPLMIIDDHSLACMVGPNSDLPGAEYGDIVRWFLSDVSPRFQAQLLDIDPLLFVDSVANELASREEGLSRVLDTIGPAYLESHIALDKRPRDYVVRPLRIACQNVVVALAAIAQESSFDGLSVLAWQTCEVSHVATHEANRALAALTLCDAFQNGGTMEIRFDRDTQVAASGTTIQFQGHPERQVPASLRRFGRTVGVLLGAEDPAAITPSEARQLFLAITPMSPELRHRVDHAVEHRGVMPERVCFLLLSQVWREIEMDFLLATSARTPSILRGGSAWMDRLARQAESELCRGAVMTGMLFRRLNATDAAGSAGETTSVRVVEDRTRGVAWTVHPEAGAITFTGIDPTELVPWTSGLSGVDTLTVFPRSGATDLSIQAMASADLPGHKALLLPKDGVAPRTDSLALLRCPDRLADIDRSIEERLLRSRISRG